MTTTTQVFTTYLYCSHCGTETEHIVLYAGPYIKEVQCSVCNSDLVRPPHALRSEFVRDLPVRAEGFAKEGITSFRRNPFGFVAHLPYKLSLKSLALCSELYVLLAERV